MADLASLAIIELEANTALFEGINTIRAHVGLPVEFLESERMKIMPRFQDRYAGARFKERIARALGEAIAVMGAATPHGANQNFASGSDTDSGNATPEVQPQAVNAEPEALSSASKQDAIPEAATPQGTHIEPPHRKGGRR